MTARPTVPTTLLADRLLAAAELADLAVAALQVATWPRANPDYEPVGCLLNARNGLLNAATSVDPIGMGFERSMMTKFVAVPMIAQTTGTVAAIVLAVLLSPASAVWYALPAAVAAWLATFRLIRYVQNRLAWAGLRAADRSPDGSVAPLDRLAELIDGVVADLQPEVSPRRRAAHDGAAAAAREVRWAMAILPPDSAAR